MNSLVEHLRGNVTDNEISYGVLFLPSHNVIQISPQWLKARGFTGRIEVVSGMYGTKVLFSFDVNDAIELPRETSY